jgi:predicted transcriptional regulator
MSAVTDVLHAMGEVREPQSIPELAGCIGAEPQEVTSAIGVLGAQGLVAPCRSGYALTKLGQRVVVTATPTRASAVSARSGARG